MKKLNFIILSINAYADYNTSDMAGSMRVKNLFNPLLQNEAINISNLILLDLLFLKNSGNNQSSIKNVDCLSIGYTSIINPFSVIGFLKKGMSFIKEHKKDDAQNIIYNYQYPNIRNFLFILYAKLKGFKIVFDLVENKEYEIPKTWNEKFNKKLSMQFLQMMPRYADMIFVISDYLFNKIILRIGKKVPVFVLPISVNFKNIVLDRRVQQNNPVKIFYGGSFAQKDGLEYLMAALVLLNEKCYQYKMILSGKAMSEDYEKIFPLIKTNSNVEYVGFLSSEAYFKLLQSVDICCMTRNNSAYANAGFPFKLGEFLAAGKIIIATRIGEVEKYLVHKESAYLVTPESSKEIAEGLIYCIDNIEFLSQRMGNKAKSVAKEYFDAEVSSRFLLEKCINF